MDKHSIICQFSAGEKPQWLKPIDFAVVVRLLALSNQDSNVAYPSILSLAMTCGGCEDTVYESLKRLRAHGWITQEGGKRRGMTNTYAVVVDALPIADDLKRTVAGDDAKRIARWYHDCLRQNGIKVYRTWNQRWPFVIQKWLNAGYSIETICAMVEFAFSNAKYVPKAKRGPNALQKVWRKIDAEYTASLTKAVIQ
jgi:Helix-turn-helix domain